MSDSWALQGEIKGPDEGRNEKEKDHSLFSYFERTRSPKERALNDKNIKSEKERKKTERTEKENKNTKSKKENTKKSKSVEKKKKPEKRLEKSLSEKFSKECSPSICAIAEKEAQIDSPTPISGFASPTQTALQRRILFNRLRNVDFNQPLPVIAKESILSSPKHSHNKGKDLGSPKKKDKVFILFFSFF